MDRLGGSVPAAAFVLVVSLAAGFGPAPDVTEEPLEMEGGQEAEQAEAEANGETIPRGESGVFATGGSAYRGRRCRRAGR